MFQYGNLAFKSCSYRGTLLSHEFLDGFPVVADESLVDLNGLQ